MACRTCGSAYEGGGALVEVLGQLGEAIVDVVCEVVVGSELVHAVQPEPALAGITHWDTIGGGGTVSVVAGIRFVHTEPQRST